METISCIKGLSKPKFKIYLGTYVYTNIAAVLVRKTEIKSNIVDFLDKINA